MCNTSGAACANRKLTPRVEIDQVQPTIYVELAAWRHVEFVLDLNDETCGTAQIRFDQIAQ